MAANREKLKASAKKHSKDDGGESLNRSSQSKNHSNKRCKKCHDKSSKGDALFCALCKALGTPKWIYQNHNTDGCRKATRKLSGGAGSQSSARSDYKKELCTTEKMLKKLKKESHELKVMCKRQKKRSDDDMSIDEASSVDTDMPL